MPARRAAYWFPLYADVRRQGHSIDDAQDLTQAFFVHLLDTQTLRVVEGGKVAARIEGGRGGANDITDIAKNEDRVV